MTAKEAIKELSSIRPRGGIIPQKRAEAIDFATRAIRMQALYEQVRWERDVAITQLEGIGLSLGEKTDRVKEALEKQIPKKVIFEDNGEVLLCPRCGFDLMGSITEPDHDPYYCFECGQALDWKVDE